MVVQHNLTAMNSNRMLGLTVKQQAKSTEKLSSGYKINRAADDAAGLSISEKMRKQIRGLTQASLNAQDGISAVQTAEGAMHEIQDMLQRMNELAVKASNGTMSADDRGYIQDEIDQLITEIDRVSETTKFNEAYLLKGDADAPKGIDFEYKETAVTSQDLYYLKDGQVETLKAGTLLTAVDTAKYDYYSADTGDLAGEVIDTADSNNYIESKNIIKTGAKYYVKGDDGVYDVVNSGEVYNTAGTYYSAKKITGTNGVVSSEMVEITNFTDTTTGYFVKGNAEMYDSLGNRLQEGSIFGTNAASISKYYAEIGNVALGPSSVDNDIATKYSMNGKVQFVDAHGNEIAANGLYRYLDEKGTLRTGAELYVKTGEGIVDRKLASQADVDSLVSKDSLFEVGSLSLKLHVGADSTKNNQITLDLDSISSRVLGIDGIKVNGTDDTNALDAIEIVKEAIQKVSTQRSALGAVQNRLEHTINNLDNVVENTTAAESQIRDTDMATEMVRFSNNNILAQAGQAMLAQANQSNQGILSILG